MMASAIVISSLAVLAIVARVIVEFDEEGPDMVKRYIDKIKNGGDTE